MTLLSSETSQEGSAGARRRRPRRPSARVALVGLLAAAAAAAVAAVAAVAVIVAGGGQSTNRPHRAAASGSQARVHVTTVFGSSIPAKQYGTELSEQQGQAPEETTPAGTGLAPVSPATLAAPIAAYRAYAVRWAATLAQEVPRLSAALAGGDRAGAEHEWSLAFSDYLHLGAVYGLLPGTLDAQIDGMPHALPGNGAPAPSFSGLHRIEMGLWTNAPMASLVPWATRLQTDVGELERVLPKVEIDPADYVTRAHEILEDAQRDFLSGSDVRWSGAGVLATAAGMDATREVVSTLKPLLEQRDATLLDIENWMYRLQAVFQRLRADHEGSWPSLGQLTLTEREEIDATLAGTLGPLAQVPGSLETTPTPTIPKLPKSR
jgi:high-affinity iron transporter